MEKQSKSGKIDGSPPQSPSNCNHKFLFYQRKLKSKSFSWMVSSGRMKVTSIEFLERKKLKISKNIPIRSKGLEDKFF